MIQRFILRAASFAATLLIPMQAIGNAADEPGIPAIIDSVAPALMEEASVPGISVALIQDHTVAWLGQYGVTSADDPKPVTAETIFEAASMSKPAFTLVVLRLVEEGVLDLDTPLVEYLGRPYIEDEPLHERITARMVLSHRTGFPNWRPGGWRRDGPLPVRFIPGTGYGYSGEGFLFLQRVIEHLTGRSTEDLTRDYLLDPAGMRTSSYVWRDEYETTASAGHTSSGKIPERARRIYHTPNTAFTLYTTPEEYAQLLITLMRADPPPVRPDLYAAMFDPFTFADGRDPLDRGDANDDGQVYFGLGWRIETTPDGRRYCHSGSNGTGFRCYSEFIPECGNGIVIMTNGVGGTKVYEGLLAAVGSRLPCSDHPPDAAGSGN